MKKTLLILTAILSVAVSAQSYAAASDATTKNTTLKTNRATECNTPADKHKKECIQQPLTHH